jgi:hypothetical protein
MAKQAGEYRFIGTVDELCFYKMNGVYYVRLKSSLTGKRFWRDKAFEGSRRSASRFGEGNRLASLVFKLVREEKRSNRLFPFLRTKAIALLKDGRCSEEVVQLLMDYLVDFGFVVVEPIKKLDVWTGEVDKNSKGNVCIMDMRADGIGNTCTFHNTRGLINCFPTLNPIEKTIQPDDEKIELYERVLKDETGMIEKPEQILLQNK